MTGGAEDVGWLEFVPAAAEEMFGGGLGGGEGFVDVAGEAHGGGAVENAGAALLVRAGAAAWGGFLKPRRKMLSRELGELMAAAWDDARGSGVYVILEVAAEQARAVPWKIGRARLQEEADAFDGAHAEDEKVGVDEDFASLLGAYAKSADGLFVHKEFDGVGVEPDLEVGGGLESLGAQAREVGLRTPTGEIGLQIGEGWFGDAEGFPDVGIVAENVAEALEVERTAIKRLEFGV